MLGKKTLLAGLIASLWGAVAVAETTWDFPTAYPESNMHTQNIRAFADNVKKLSNGELVFNIHSNASLFKMPEIKRAIQTNQVQIGEFILTAYANEDPIFELDGVPFVASGYDAAWKLYQAQKAYLEKKLESQGMKLLFTVAWPPQGIFVNKELNSVDDLKGLKWRAYSPVTAKIAQLVGAQPVTIQQAELTQALATGAVNALMTSSATGYDIKINEFIKYFYDNEAWLPKNAVVVNKKSFSKLTEEQQKVVMTAAEQAEKAGWELSRQKTDFFKSSLAKEGLKIIKPSETLQNGLVEKTKIMLEDWKKRAGADGEKLLEAYQK